MWIRFIIISFILALFTFSCNKEPNTWDKENDLDFDTTTFLFSAKYISNIDTQVTLQLDIVTLNGLNSETNYSSQQYFDSVRSYANHIFDISSVTKNKFLATSYTSVFLFDQNNAWWYAQEKAGFYLRRYFESVSNSSTAQVGLSSFSSEGEQSTQFYAETPNVYFDNSWEYNTNTFYDIVEFDENQGYSPVNLVDVINSIDETIDHMLGANGKQGDLSITFFSEGNFGDDQNNKVLIDNLILKANTNQVRINLVGFNYDYESGIRRLALETGGFIGSNKIGYESVSPIYDESKKVSNTGVILENLNLILSRNVTSHRCNLVVDIKAGQGSFISGTAERIQVDYNGNLYTVQFTIP